MYSHIGTPEQRKFEVKSIFQLITPILAEKVYSLAWIWNSNNYTTGTCKISNKRNGGDKYFSRVRFHFCQCEGFYLNDPPRRVVQLVNVNILLTQLAAWRLIVWWPLTPGKEGDFIMKTLHKAVASSIFHVAVSSSSLHVNGWHLHKLSRRFLVTESLIQV